ncbi:MAG: adenylate/guanylate cyclase domain-containing protein, partial [Actinomycetota bacterium]|nr:adenylate/guanylate cyclase domain-containing protein [Actinomycetota bacterium]
MMKQPSGTVSLLFSDIEGSTVLLRELGEERYADALEDHRCLLRAAFERHEGYEVDCEGDAFFVAFQSAEDAVASAAEAQQALAAHAWPEGREFRVRMGIHTGEPLLAPPKYVGVDVHRAARIMAAGHGGQVLVSQVTRDLVEDSFALVDLGPHRLKDISAAERVYQLGEEGFPPLRSLYQTNLPVPATSFLGRERELAEVVASLGREEVRLLTLTGSGGTGKTRLALQAAAEVSAAFPGGVFWVPLAPLRDQGLVLATVAQALDVREEPGRSLVESVAERLAGQQALVLLDNVEHLLPTIAADVAALAAAAPTARFLITSRERLQLSGEHVYAVPTLSEGDGVALFIARAAQADAAFMETPAVAELCRRLDELPLALELAAARTTLFRPEQLLERLGQRLDLFKGGRDADPRQQTLRATIEWSYDLLTAEEKRLFSSLSVFVGGCTYDAAEAVAGGDPDSLQSLLDKSLLRRRETEVSSRYWMLETIREFALEQLAARGELARIEQKHTAFYARLAEGLQLGIRRRTMNADARLSALARVNDELPNLRAGLAKALEGLQARLAGDYLEALWYPW